MDLDGFALRLVAIAGVLLVVPAAFAVSGWPGLATVEWYALILAVLFAPLAIALLFWRKHRLDQQEP